MACRRTKLRVPSAVSPAGARCGTCPPSKRRFRRLIRRPCTQFNGLSLFSLHDLRGCGRVYDDARASLDAARARPTSAADWVSASPGVHEGHEQHTLGFMRLGDEPGSSERGSRWRCCDRPRSTATAASLALGLTSTGLNRLPTGMIRHLCGTKPRAEPRLSGAIAAQSSTSASAGRAGPAGTRRRADASQVYTENSFTTVWTKSFVAALRLVLSDACIEMDGGWTEETRRMTPQWSSSFRPGTDKLTPLPQATAHFCLN
jgi:hypothetical protein